MLKATSKDAKDRYQSAESLGEDLRRFVEGQTILARRASLSERIVRWCRRNPVVSGLVAALLLTFAFGTPTLVALLVRAQSAQHRAERA